MPTFTVRLTHESGSTHEAHGTPCLICAGLACSCRAAGTLEATPGAWPIDRPDDSERASRARRCPTCGAGAGEPCSVPGRADGMSHATRGLGTSERVCPCGNPVRAPFTYCAEATCLGWRPTSSRRPDHASHGWML